MRKILLLLVLLAAGVSAWFIWHHPPMRLMPPPLLFQAGGDQLFDLAPEMAGAEIELFYATSRLPVGPRDNRAYSVAPDWRLHVGKAQLRIGDEETTLREAEACARRAFELNPRSAQGLSIMGQVAYRRGNAGEAVRLLTQACAADPNNPDAMHQLGGAYLLGGRIGPMREVLTRLVQLDPLTASNHCLLGLSCMLGGNATEALPSHQRAVELDPRSTICRVCYAIALVAAGREAEAASLFEWLEQQPADDHLAAVALRFRRGLSGDREAVLSPPSAAERAMAESDEYWSYLMAAAYALVGEADQALSWLDHAVTMRGWVDYVYFTRHDRFLERVRPTRRFQELMASARERYARFTDAGTPAELRSV